MIQQLFTLPFFSLTNSKLEQERIEKNAQAFLTCHNTWQNEKKHKKGFISESRNTVDNLESDSNYPEISW